MTNREFFVAIASNTNLTADLRDHAQAQVDKMDASNAKSRGTESKTYKANIPLFAEVLELLAEKPMLTTEIALAMTSDERPISNSKASGLLKTLQNEGKVSQTKVKVKGKGEQTQWAIIITSSEE